ncbi:MAG TPA: TadE/TadG family type IV pilus assembly protein [Terracidiphilus sp.]|nr:TadE/TadG family type IV pilus assembly protein [Terracidiphilus sp.]
MKHLGNFNWNGWMRRMSSFRLVKSERGQSLIELALVLPLLLTILLGTTELGRMAYAAIEVSDAAGAGALYGSQNLFTASDTSGMQQASTNDAADIKAWTSNGIDVTAVRSCTCTDGTVIMCSTAGSKCISPARIQMYVQVSTAATINMLFAYTNGHPRTYTVRGQTIMKVAQ